MSELNSQAEQLAKKATESQEFRNLNLAGVKDKVAEILSLIGHVPGIFSTYTKHDISHIDSMLRMLDWLVPPSTMEVMTPVDWLLTVLSIYLHDLGMVVTREEYDGRIENQDFQNFLERLNKDSDAKDYLARVETMPPDERDRFFYQEFIRLQHAARIREWITGRHSRQWGEKIKPIADEIAKMMEALPSRFREHLAVICESHNKEDLNKTDIYPLLQRYGQSDSESANVQYAAFLLRTADLIHVTKDRTPSMMYKTIGFSDLKSIEEWDKQRTTFAVNKMGRDFDPIDKESHFIVISADFTEERPFFALTEYLAWANSQLSQTKRWADMSQQVRDGKDFFFPWRGIKGDIRVEGNQPRQMRFELDRGRLLDLLVGHTIYNDATVAVRELLQNAIDAVRFQYHLDQKNDEQKGQSRARMGRVLIKWDPKTYELIVEDDGIGMNLDTIQNHLLRVGASFYDTPQFQIDNTDFTPISRFGIGVLTCFMISDNIEIITYREQEGKRIRMTSVHADYLLKDLMTGDPQLEGLEPHGTRVRLSLRPSVDLKKKSILDIIHQWVILPACDVIYSEVGCEDQTIGFKSVADALQHLKSETQNASTKDRDSYEILTVIPEGQVEGDYDLAFIVQRGFVPERVFSTDYGNQIAGGVCIEGIRTDWHLPGFSTEFPALLSVRNNRRFRTTVSRSSLEQDDEYFRVATLCAKALFGHVTTEVKRIADLSGNPLSQASTAGRWVYSSLRGRVVEPTRKVLSALYNELPLVVVEEMQPNDTNLSSQRSLKSLKEIAALANFWTIESRTVDYLGTISRDLGRELSITDFLGTLAPELVDPRVNPVITDAHLFSDTLLESHTVAEIEFSRKHQRTLLQWKQRVNLISGDNSNLQFNQFFIRAFETVFERIGLANLVRDTRDIVNVISRREINRIIVANVKGDIEDIHGVKTRVATILSTNGHIAEVWKLLEAAWSKLLSTNSLIIDQAALLAARYILAMRFNSSRSYDNYYGRPFDLSAPWRALRNDVNAILEKLDVQATLPDDLDDIFGQSRNWFDASSYWRNWDQYSVTP